ncbi:hypothetical protein RI129_005093 [Pyrocoelia pectoralis]|uniref:DUF229 domain containing protein n=1 Tax=Pyrocoelia pectoralis TaxID=417401 RepID=A0AAN7VHP7_9COLE
MGGSYVIKTEGCRIPYMDPFDPSIRQYIIKEKQFTCNNNTPPLMDSNLTSVYLKHNSLAAYNITDLTLLKCCYSVFHRKDPSSNQADNQIAYNKCVYFNESTIITDEFVRVSCTFNKSEVYKDFFSFVPLKPEVAKFSVLQAPPEKLNVLIIGLDSVSRVNFHRQMPKTLKVLQKMGAIEFLGYNKVADNTLPNLGAILTGMALEELVTTCWRKRSDRFDDCNFLWKNYSNNNYATVFAEDSAWMGMFHYTKMGFKKQPTDYYWGPFDYAAEKNIGNAIVQQASQCVGSRPIYQVLLHYTQKFTQVMHHNHIPYFGLFWSASLSHNFLNKPQLGDESYANFFDQLQKFNILKNTVLIFMSDHGIRFGPIRTTYQGRMEERLPFLFTVFPTAYRETYYQVYANLNRNSKRLTTPFDLHETLKDLLNPFSLNQELLNIRILNRTVTKRGYSLFEPIPTNRTCEAAGISVHWCTCQNSTVVDINSSAVVDATTFLVQYMNKQLDGYADCAKLTLVDISNARLHANNDELKGSTEDYTIAFRTAPGDGHFEATVRCNLIKKSNKSHFDIIGTISRINLYGNQSACITDFNLKLYCYCTEQLYEQLTSTN